MFMASVYLVSGRIEVCIDHRGVHLPLLNVSRLPKFPPGLDLIVNAMGKQGWSNYADGVDRREAHEALNMFSKNLLSSIFTGE